ncbi:MAG: regulatory protein RecX [Spirochaetales bacterium]|nr:regulatory protein RecX [Spirochaetales bacterium]
MDNNKKKNEPSGKKGGSSVSRTCRDQALVYLSMREHNRRELALKLRSKDYPSDEIERTLDELEDDGLLSEVRYVQVFVRSNNRRHPEGKAVVFQRLASKGADREVARQVVDEIYTREYTRSLVQQARALIVKKGRATSEDEIRFELKKIGFSNNDVANFD